MTKTFPDERAEDLSKIWNDILSLQVNQYAPAEMNLLKTLGYYNKIKSPILDLGCGNGVYSEFLAKEFQKSKIVAVDANDVLLDEFRDRIKDLEVMSQIEIFKWIAGEERLTKTMCGCHTIFIRLMLSHFNHNKQKLFEHLNSNLSKGSLVIVIEEDDGFFHIYPECRAWQRFIDLLIVYQDTTGKVKRFEGRKVPYYAGMGGLNVEYSNIFSHSSVNIGAQKLMNHFIAGTRLIQETMKKIVSLDEAEKMIEEMNEYIEKYGNNCFFVYPNIVTIARTQ